MSRSNGRLEPEVIVNVRPIPRPSTNYITKLHTCLQYGDGFAYSKYKMEEAFRTGGFLDKPATKASAVASGKGDPSLPLPKREDIDVIVRVWNFNRAISSTLMLFIPCWKL